jgi:hypothetical protein
MERTNARSIFPDFSHSSRMRFVTSLGINITLEASIRRVSNSFSEP